MGSLDALKEALSRSGLASAFVPTELGTGVQNVCPTKAVQCNSYSATCASLAAQCSGTCAAWCNSLVNARCTGSGGVQCQSRAECNA